MAKEILRVRLTHNVKQLKKYVDKAIEDGADRIVFDMDKENPYFTFFADFTPEQQNEYTLNQLKKDFEKKLSYFQNRKFKTHSFRIKQYGLCGAEIDKLVEEFKEKNQIKESLNKVIKQVINDEYDDFDEGMETVFVTEIIQD